MNVSEMGPEKELAKIQLETLTRMAENFTDNETFAMDVMFADDMVMVMLEVDEASLMFDMMSEKMEEGGDEDLEPYLDKKNLSSVLVSQDDILERWRDICRTAHELDKADETNFNFVYYANVSVFECSVTAHAPVLFHINFTCTGFNGSGRVISGWEEDDDTTTQTMRWSDPQCTVEEAECIVESMDDWKVTLKPTIWGKSSDVIAYTSDVETKVIASLTVVALVLLSGLLGCGIYWYRVSGRARRGWSSGYFRAYI